MNERRTLLLRIAASILALSIAALHMVFPRFIPDAISIGLILFAVIPWISPIIQSIEVAGVGKLVLQVQEVKKNQANLQDEVDALRFLLSGFVTDWEYEHLRKLAGGLPFEYQRGAGKDDRFTGEVIRMRDFGLISKRISYALWDIPLSGNLKDYVELTDRGRSYLKLREYAKA